MLFILYLRLCIVCNLFSSHEASWVQSFNVKLCDEALSCVSLVYDVHIFYSTWTLSLEADLMWSMPPCYRDVTCVVATCLISCLDSSHYVRGVYWSVGIILVGSMWTICHKNAGLLVNTLLLPYYLSNDLKWGNFLINFDYLCVLSIENDFKTSIQSYLSWLW